MQYAKKLEKQTADRLANGVWDPMKPTDIVLDVYKHVEFQHLEISIEPKTFRIFEGRKDLEAWFQRDNLDIKQLIEDGILFKVCTNVYGTIHLRRWHVLGGEGSKICQICQQIVLKNCRR